MNISAFFPRPRLRPARLAAALLASLALALAPAGFLSGADAPAAAGPVSFGDDFSGYRNGAQPVERWFCRGEWEVRNGALRGTDARRSLAAPADIPYGAAVSIEAKLSPRAATGKDWKTAGVAVWLDERNYWLLCLTEFPDAMGAHKHIAELNEMIDGVWQAQAKDGAPTFLEKAPPDTAEAPLAAGGPWQSGRPFILRLEITPQGIAGSIREEGAEAPFFRQAYRFPAEGEGKVVRAGVPLLWNQSFDAAFDDVSAKVSGPVSPPPSGAINARTPLPGPKVAAAGADWSVRSDFDDAPEEAAVPSPWMATSRYWETRRKALRGADPGRTFATVGGAPVGTRLRIEADVSVEQSLGGSWKQAGLAVLDDRQRYWLLCLTEEPGRHAGAKHMAELSEMLPGNNWQAQNRDGTRLECVESRTFLPWAKNARYRMRLELADGIVEGSIFGAHGEPVFHALYRIPAADSGGAATDAVRRGSPALWNQGFDASFDNVELVVDGVDAAAPVPWIQVPPREDFSPYPARPYTAAPMGGRADGDPPGFFRVETGADGVSWFVDPNGFRYFSIGVEQVKYSGHFSPALGYSPYNRNIMAKFGGSIQKWADSASARLREWGFNTASVMPYTIAPGGGEAFLDGIAVTLIVNLGQSFVPYSDLSPVTINGFPNVFHPRWEEHCEAAARDFCARFRDNPWILGYYIDNELDWHGSNCAAFFIHTAGSGPLEYGLVLDILRKPADHSARIALIDFLRSRHGSIGALNEAWGTDFASFEEIDADRAFVFGDPVPGAVPDARDFLRLIAERYYSATSAAIRKADPNHLVLGTRFAGWSQDPVWEMCGKYCDVVSVNHYPFVELEEGTVQSAREMLRRVVTLCRRPILLSEWSFLSLDCGLPCRHGAGERFDTEDQRARAFQIYQSMLFETPFCVGSDYFMWIDDPKGGVASDSNPEDCNYGLVTEEDEPHETLVAAATEINRAAIALHSQSVPRLSFPDARTLAVENRGPSPCRAIVELYEDGVQRKDSVSLAAGETAMIPIHPRRQGAAGYVQARVRVEGLVASDGQSAWIDNLGLLAADAAVANPADAAVSHALVEIPLRPGEKVRAIGAGDAFPPQQIEERDGARTLVVDAGDLPPHSAAIFRLVPDAEAPVLAPAPVTLPFAHGNGVLSFRKDSPDGMLFDAIALDGDSLGALHPLLWQKTPGNQFVRPSRLLSLAGIVGPVRATLDFDLVLADASAAERIPETDRDGRPVPPSGIASGVGAFRAKYRVVIPAGTPYFTTQFRGAANLADFPWTLDRYYHYMPSRLGGSAEGDRPQSSVDVTEYFNPSLLWFDDAARLGYGVIRPRSFFGSSFRIDPDGTQHPDLCRVVRLRLEPGEAWWTDSEPAIPLFGCRGGAAAAPWESVAREMSARSSLLIRIGR